MKLRKDQSKQSPKLKQEKTARPAHCPPTVGWHEMNRKQRREMARKIQAEDLSLEVVHPHAAGIDIGNESHYVAVPPTRDEQLRQYLAQKQDRSAGASLPEEKHKARRRMNRKNNPQFDMREQLFRTTGVDLTRIDGIEVLTAMTVISEAGWDRSKWPDEDHFVSWLRLSPDNRISGDRVIGKGRLPTNNRLSVALRMAANTLRESNSYLGAQFRRLKRRLDAPVAIKAMAAKLARLIYRMLRYGMQFVDQGAEVYEAAHRQREIHYLKQKAASLGFQIIEAAAS